MPLVIFPSKALRKISSWKERNGSGTSKSTTEGRIMECALEAQISYVDFPKNIRAQRECVEAKVREMTTAHVV